LCRQNHHSSMLVKPNVYKAQTPMLGTSTRRKAVAPYRGESPFLPGLKSAIVRRRIL
jgi:hypothetical protein